MNNNSNVFNLYAHSKRNGGKKATNATIGFLKGLQCPFFTFIIDGAMIHVYQFIRSSTLAQCVLKVYVQQGCSTDRPKTRKQKLNRYQRLKKNREEKVVVVVWSLHTKKYYSEKMGRGGVILDFKKSALAVHSKYEKRGRQMRHFLFARSSGFSSLSL